MTDDDDDIELLRQLWLEGWAYGPIAKRLGVTKSVISGRVRALRAREGETAWPSRGNPIHPKAATLAPPPRRGTAPTLPPLPSLREC